MSWRGPLVLTIVVLGGGCSPELGQPPEVGQPPGPNLVVQTGAVLATGGVLNPTGGFLTPTGGVLTPTGGVLTPTGGVLTPTGGVLTPTGGVLTPTGGVLTPTGGVVATGGSTSSSMEPTIPTVSGDCPSFRDGTISYMGLNGIQIVTGSKPAGPTGPMVFYWHGTGGRSGEFASQAAAVRAGVVAQGGVLVSFQGTTGGDLRSGTSVFGIGDYDIADQLVACAVRDHNVDPRRIFATGCSAGGLFSAAMAAERSNYMAAAAPNSGGWVLPTMAFQGGAPPALMTIHGAPGRDVVVVDFSETSTTADNGFKSNGGFVINCNHGGGHCGGGSLASDIWEFFEAHPYGTKPDPWASGLPAGFHASCEIF